MYMYTSAHLLLPATNAQHIQLHQHVGRTLSLAPKTDTQAIQTAAARQTFSYHVSSSTLD